MKVINGTFELVATEATVTCMAAMSAASLRAMVDWNADDKVTAFLAELLSMAGIGLRVKAITAHVGDLPH